MRYVLATALLLVLGGVWVAGQRVAPPNRGGANFILTTTGTSGASTYVGGVLNIPVYATGGGTVTSFSAGNLASLFTTSVAMATSTPALTFAFANGLTANDVYATNGSGAAGLYAPTTIPMFTLTTTGSSGASTYSGGTLNIPQYTGGTTYTGTAPIVVSGSTISVSNATSSTVGVMKPDNSTCSVSAGVLTCVGSSGLTTGMSGALNIASGVIDIVTTVLGTFTSANPWTGKNTFQQGIFTYGAPSISSGFGTSPSISSASGPGGGRITVGSGGSATTGVIAWAIQPAVAPACTGNDETSAIPTRVAATTTGLTLYGASAWSAADTLTYTCTGLSTTLP